MAYYLTRMNPYGIPLDSRCDYTKSDWEMWTVVLDDNEEYRKQIIHTMWKALCSLDRRAPFPDWYHTETPKAEGFQNRTVQGGTFHSPVELVKKISVFSDLPDGVFRSREVSFYINFMAFTDSLYCIFRRWGYNS